MADPQVDPGLLEHPLRRQILRQFVAMDEPLSPDRVAKDLGTPLNRVSYHIRVLADAGALILVDKRPVRGAVQHIYVVDDAKVTRQPWVREALGLPEDPNDE